MRAPRSYDYGQLIVADIRKTEHDAAFGVRTSRNDARIRLVLTRIIRYFVCIWFGTYLRDANVPFKIVRRQVWLSARPWIPAGTLSCAAATFCSSTGGAVHSTTPQRDSCAGMAANR